MHLVSMCKFRLPTGVSLMQAWFQREQKSFSHALNDTALHQHQSDLVALMQQGHDSIEKHGDFLRWQAALDALPDIEPELIDLQNDCIHLGLATQLNQDQQQVLVENLQQFHPWRKGPFSIFGNHIDTEWRSDWKWQRLEQYIAPLSGRTVLDIGCGSGYHVWRMCGADAAMVIGIDPTALFAMQFELLKRSLQKQPAFYIPVGIEAMPEIMPFFDTVFSMGVLYHRRSPIDHLFQLKSLLRRGGELVLETLVIEGASAEQCLLPPGRYAKMRNVWFIPSIPMLECMLARAGYCNIRCIHQGPTTTEEQRQTEWMRFDSLASYLNPAIDSLTIEGHPAPNRAIILANKP